MARCKSADATSCARLAESNDWWAEPYITRTALSSCLGIESTSDPPQSLEVRRNLESLISSYCEQLPLPGDVLQHIAEAMESGTPSQRKALLQELVSEIRVESRDAIFPTYRLPNGPVRVMSGVVPIAGPRPLPPMPSSCVCDGVIAISLSPNSEF